MMQKASEQQSRATALRKILDYSHEPEPHVRLEVLREVKT